MSEYYLRMAMVIFCPLGLNTTIFYLENGDSQRKKRRCTGRHPLAALRIHRSCGVIAFGCSRTGCRSQKTAGTRGNKGKRVVNMAETKQSAIVPTEKDLEIIRLMRQTDYGKVLVTVKNGEPVHAEMQKSIPIK